MQWHSSQGVEESPSLGVFQSHGDVALRCGQWAWWGGLGLVTSEVYSNLNDFMIPRISQVKFQAQNDTAC